MSILIIDRTRLNELDYVDALGVEKMSTAIMFGEYEERSAYLENFRHFPNFRENWQVEYCALELVAGGAIERVIATSEYDILRAARIRACAALPGQTVESAKAFRDKVIMKDLARKRVQVPIPYRRLESAVDLFEFVDEVNLPIVIKPVDGAGSLRASVIHDRADLMSWLGEGSLQGFEVEPFIHGDMYIVDGLYCHGKIQLAWSSRYVSDCLSHTRGEGVSVAQIGDNNPIHTRLMKFCEELFLALPMPETTTFHTEVFLTPGDELVLCEVASRTGGGAIRRLGELTFGVDLHMLWIRSQAGMDISAQIEATRQNSVMYGFAQIPPIKSEIAKLPNQIPFDFVVEYIQELNPTLSDSGPLESSSKSATIIVRGESTEILERNLGHVVDWMRSAI